MVETNPDALNNRLGAALGNAIAGYRDKNADRAAEGLAEIVAIVRELEERIARLERRRPENLLVG